MVSDGKVTRESMVIKGKIRYADLSVAFPSDKILLRFSHPSLPGTEKEITL